MPAFFLAIRKFFSPKVMMAVAVGVMFLLLLQASYKHGVLTERAANETAVREAVEQALADSAAVTQAAFKRERDAVKRLEEFKQRDDEESITWAAKPIPDGELERMRKAVDSISARAGSLPDPM